MSKYSTALIIAFTITNHKQLPLALMQWTHSMHIIFAIANMDKLG